MESISEISCLDLKRQLDQGNKIVLLDVREARELTICKLDNIIHIPLGELPFRFKEIEPHKNQELIVYCRSGQRSAMATQFLQSNGFTKAKNLQGGILAWSDEIDPSLSKY